MSKHATIKLLFPLSSVRIAKVNNKKKYGRKKGRRIEELKMKRINLKELNAAIYTTFKHVRVYKKTLNLIVLYVVNSHQNKEKVK